MAESVTEVRGTLSWGLPKDHQQRLVPVPRFLVDLAESVAAKASHDLVFTTVRGAALRNLNFRRDVFDRAAIMAGLDGLTPHELRHTAASPAVSAGANVKSIQRMLGHASAAMTLDVYSGLFETTSTPWPTGWTLLPLGCAQRAPRAFTLPSGNAPQRPDLR